MTRLAAMLQRTGYRAHACVAQAAAARRAIITVEKVLIWRPRGNTTGISMLASELDGKRQEILIEAVPGLRRMAALADTTTTPNAELDELQESARARDIELSIHRSPQARRSQQPSTRPRHRAPQR